MTVPTSSYYAAATFAIIFGAAILAWIVDDLEQRTMTASEREARDAAVVSNELRRLIDDIAPTERRRDMGQRLRRELLAAARPAGRPFDEFEGMDVEWRRLRRIEAVARALIDEADHSWDLRALRAALAEPPESGP